MLYRIVRHLRELYEAHRDVIARLLTDPRARPGVRFDGGAETVSASPVREAQILAREVWKLAT